MSVLVDSCVLIDALVGVPEARVFLRAQVAPAISRLTWIEVMVGAREPAEEATLRAFLGAFEVLPVDDEVAEEAVAVRRRRRLKLPDAIILATARVHRRVLATGNTRDFGSGEEGVVVPYLVA